MAQEVPREAVKYSSSTRMQYLVLFLDTQPGVEDGNANRLETTGLGPDDEMTLEVLHQGQEIVEWIVVVLSAGCLSEVSRFRRK